MAGGRKRVMGELAAWHLAMLVARLPFTAKLLDPDQINPYRVERPKSAAMLELEAWKAGQTLKMRLSVD